GERIVVVDEQDHGSFPSSPGCPNDLLVSRQGPGMLVAPCSRRCRPRRVKRGTRGSQMNAVEVMRQGLAQQPADDTGWLALADCLEEQGAGEQAELVRLQLWLRRRLDDLAW